MSSESITSTITESLPAGIDSNLVETDLVESILEENIFASKNIMKLIFIIIVSCFFKFKL